MFTMDSLTAMIVQDANQMQVSVFTLCVSITLFTLMVAGFALLVGFLAVPPSHKRCY